MAKEKEGGYIEDVCEEQEGADKMGYSIINQGHSEKSSKEKDE